MKLSFSDKRMKTDKSINLIKQNRVFLKALTILAVVEKDFFDVNTEDLRLFKKVLRKGFWDDINKIYKDPLKSDEEVAKIILKLRQGSYEFMLHLEYILSKEIAISKDQETAKELRSKGLLFSCKESTKKAIQANEKLRRDLLDYTDLDYRAYSRLQNVMGIKSLGELALCKEEGLRKIPGLGSGTLTQIKRVLKTNGLSLDMSESEIRKLTKKA
jgi:hypothetical protein